MAANDDYVIKFWEMDSKDLLETSNAEGDLPITIFILKPTYTNSSNTILALTSNAIHLIWRWPYEAKATTKNPTQLWHPISGTLIAQDLTNVRIEEAKPISLCPKMILTSFQHQVKSKLEDHSKLIAGLGFSSLHNLLVSIGADDQWSIPKMSTLISHATFSCNSYFRLYGTLWEHVN
ncbi:hypothetical protein HYC85_012496 [Camellia sinensis]|uniref:Uncharacterized protein n=1 Tax=Camellia sinensis TaxID=4442 RepID=A0A7J7HC39_CAMSI|nr:hypothetical protein HYC85_012496 [Camellia sinensis]